MLFRSEHSALLTLFTSSLLSSTLLPGGSEALLIWMGSETSISKMTLLLVSTAGNTLGGIFTWAVGFFVAKHWSEGRRSKKISARISDWIHRYGPPILLLSWLPVVGDGLCLAAGWYKLSFLPILLFIFLGKVGRYALLLWFL